MAADVTSLIRLLNGGRGGGDNDKARNSPAGLITRDLLGGGGGSSDGHQFFDSKELDLDMQVPSGWEKRLDLKTGKVSLHQCDSSNSSSSSDQKKPRSSSSALSKFQDLNLPPSPKPPLSLFDESSLLELKLNPTSSSESPSSPMTYQSVCTLDKVKSALQRAERADSMRKRSISMSSSSPSPLSNSSSSVKDCGGEADDHEERSFPTGGSFAAGCPKCHLYVLISVDNPRCPGCSTAVPLPRAKKPRIDLNISI